VQSAVSRQAKEVLAGCGAREASENLAVRLIFSRKFRLGGQKLSAANRLYFKTFHRLLTPIAPTRQLCQPNWLNRQKANAGFYSTRQRLFEASL
jgi:hypothetical protein